MSVRILIADPDESFGLMLKQILETNVQYVADAYTTGAATLTSAQKRKPDLVIVDAALADMSAAALIASLQLIRPGVSIMLIPMGSTLPEEYQQLGVRGILTKPFFVGNLDKYIRDVLSAEPSRAAQPLPDFAQKKILSRPNVGTDVTESKPAVPDKRTTAASTVTSIAKVAGNLAARIPRLQNDHGTTKVEPKGAGEPPEWISGLSKDASTTLASQSTPSADSLPVPSAMPPAVGPKPSAKSSATADLREISPASPPPGEPRSTPVPPRVRQTISAPRRSVTESDSARPSPATDPGVAIERTLAALIRELRADAVYVLKNGEPLHTRGGLPGLTAEALAEVLSRWARTAADLAALVGENRGRFVQFHAEGERYHVYAFDTGSGLMLVVICRTDIPFGTLRLTLKATGSELTKLMRS